MELRTRPNWLIGAIAGLVLCAWMAPQLEAQDGTIEPVFDVHLHALAADGEGPPPLGMCMPIEEFLAWDQREPYGAAFMRLLKQPPCEHPVWSPATDDELMQKTVEVMQRNHVYGVLSGTLERVAAWREAAPDRFVPGLGFNLSRSSKTIEELRRLFEQETVQVLAEVTNQYAGIAPDDDRMEPFWALAEELDVPVGIHIGNGPPGVHHLGSSGYRARLHSALTLEPVLVKHPKLRVYIMHAGYPMIDDLLALLYTHPQVHVGVGVISFTTPTAAYYRFLERIVEAGFASRILFGSDQMVWPEAIEFAIERVRAAPFLSESQKRAILYDNAARFFRFDQATIDRHRGN